MTKIRIIKWNLGNKNFKDSGKVFFNFYISICTYFILRRVYISKILCYFLLCTNCVLLVKVSHGISNWRHLLCGSRLILFNFVNYCQFLLWKKLQKLIWSFVIKEIWVPFRETFLGKKYSKSLLGAQNRRVGPRRKLFLRFS